MRDAAEITGQKHVLSKLRDWLENKGSSKCVVVEGPSGSGKSWLINELGHHLLSFAGRVVIRAAGDPLNSSRPLLPLLGALARTQRVSRFIKGAAVAGAQASPFSTGALLSFIVENSLNWKEKNSAALTPFLTVAERDILVELQLRAGKSQLLLVLEDLQWWDETSLSLLKLMLGGYLDGAFPFLSRTKFVAVVRSDVLPAAKSLSEVRELLGEHVLKLRYCEEACFKDLLLSLGMELPPTDAECQALHNVTQGHLGLALEIARLGQADGPNLAIQGDGLNLDDICSKLMSWRLDQLGERGTAIAELLTQASAIGLSFSKSEIMCLIESDASSLSRQMRDASSLDLISIEGDLYAFRHDLLRRYFINRPIDDDQNIHARFAECLRKLRPGQYAERRQHLALAREFKEASNMGAHACLSLERDARLTPERRLGLVEHAGPIARFVDTMLKATRLAENGKYAEGLQLIGEIDLTYSDGLLAEKAILAARCLIKLLTQDKFKEAVQILGEASRVYDSEPEVWSRVILASVVANAYAGDTEASKRKAMELARWAAPRQSFDPDAARVLHRLNVKADLYLVPESAAAVLAEACTYFGPSHDDGGARDPINYFIALTNLSGNELMRGDFDRAHSTAAKANYFLQQCRRTGDVGDFPRVDMHLNNLVVAGWQSGAWDLPSCINAFDNLIENTPATNDRPLLESNRAVLKIMSGDLVAPLKDLRHLFKALSSHDDYDAYYVYFIGNNLTGALYAAKQVEEAKAIWNALGQVVAKLDTSRLPYRKRHDIQSRCFSKPSCEATAEVWEKHLAKEANLPLEGPSWAFLARGFLLSDLQYWSDD
jgi:DNA polymerase III delta prime subunit